MIFQEAAEVFLIYSTHFEAVLRTKSRDWGVHLSCVPEECRYLGAKVFITAIERSITSDACIITKLLEET